MDKKFPPWKLTRAHQSVFLSHIWSKRQLDMVWISETELVKLTLPILQSFWQSLWHLSPLFEQLVKKHLNTVGWGVGGSKSCFPWIIVFLIPKFVLGGPRWKSKEIQTSRLFCVNFKSVLCQSCIFLHWFDPAPSPFDIVKKCKIGTMGHPQKMMMQQKWDQLRT